MPNPNEMLEIVKLKRIEIAKEGLKPKLKPETKIEITKITKKGTHNPTKWRNTPVDQSLNMKNYAN